MIAQWMLGALAFSVLCAVAAYALERGLRAMRQPARMPWALAVTVATAWPLLRALCAASAKEVMLSAAPTAAASLPSR